MFGLPILKFFHFYINQEKADDGDGHEKEETEETSENCNNAVVQEEYSQNYKNEISNEIMEIDNVSVD